VLVWIRVCKEIANVSVSWLYLVIHFLQRWVKWSSIWCATWSAQHETTTRSAQVHFLQPHIFKVSLSHGQYVQCFGKISLFQEFLNITKKIFPVIHREVKVIIWRPVYESWRRFSIWCCPKILILMKILFIVFIGIYIFRPQSGYFYSSKWILCKALLWQGSMCVWCVILLKVSHCRATGACWRGPQQSGRWRRVGLM